jgi:hypothetical protein
MSLKVSVDLEGYPKGKPLGFNGLGVIENGGSIELTEANESAFFADRGMIVADAFKDQEGVSVSGSAEFTPPKDDPQKNEVETPQQVTPKTETTTPSDGGGE